MNLESEGNVDLTTEMQGQAGRWWNHADPDYSWYIFKKINNVYYHFSSNSAGSQNVAKY